MLTNYLSMPGIIAIIRGIYRKGFKYIYFKNQELFVNMLMNFSNVHKILNIFIKKDVPISLSISEVIHCKKGGCLNA